MTRRNSYIIVSVLAILASALCAASIYSAQSVESSSVALADSLAEADSSRTITLLFAGDLMQHTQQIKAGQRPDGGYDYSACFQYMKPEIERADVAIANSETRLAGPPYTGYPQFCSPDRFLQDCRDAGFDIMLTANNHVCDRYKAGIERTIQVMDSLGVPHLGSYVNQQ